MGCSWTVMLEKTPESPLDCKEIQPANPKGNQSWIFIGKTDAEAETPILWLPDGKELTHLKRPWCWERLKTGGERDNRGWDGWMASPTRRTWVWVSSGSWWLAGKPGVLQSMGLQSMESDMTEWLNWTELWSWLFLFQGTCFSFCLLSPRGPLSLTTVRSVINPEDLLQGRWSLDNLPAYTSEVSGKLFLSATGLKRQDCAVLSSFPFLSPPASTYLGCSSLCDQITGLVLLFSSVASFSITSTDIALVGPAGFIH